jgi:DNA-binding HxlR family transcriptional regulator
MRLTELERSGYILRAERTRAYTKWQLPQKGADVLPVLLTLIHFGSKWNTGTDSGGAQSPALGYNFDVTYLPGPLGNGVGDPRR